jgi:hypothetical protein
MTLQVNKIDDVVLLFNTYKTLDEIIIESGFKNLQLFETITC